MEEEEGEEVGGGWGGGDRERRSGARGEVWEEEECWYGLWGKVNGGEREQGVSVDSSSPLVAVLCTSVFWGQLIRLG